MQKQKKYNIADSNIANLGSDLEKKVREAAAQKEPAWENAGKKVGLQVWRIEKFKVKVWPPNLHGTFYDGDSYIVLNTYQKKDSPALLWDVHFWLGTYTTQDEAGTAAYKTVELDDKLGGAPIQHREVQGFETEQFMNYFNGEIKLLTGGVDSGFNKVKPTEYKPRLMQLKGRRKIRVTEVPLERASLNSGDVFILDKGMQVFQWNGSKSGPGEKLKGAQLSKAIADERAAKLKVLEENDTEEDFWSTIGGQGSVKSAEEGGEDQAAEGVALKEKTLFHLSDATGKMVFQQVATGGQCKKSLLKSEDVFILDTGMEVFAWIGKGASVDEKSKALSFAQDYLTNNKRPPQTPITRIIEGAESQLFKQHLN